MNLIRITSLASVGFAVLVEPAFAGQPVPGPIAGIGLPALVLIGWRILGSSKVFWRQGEKSTRDNPSGECPLSGVKRTSLSHATGVNQPLRFFKRSVACGAIELERNQIKRLVLACRFDLAAIGFGNYRSPQSIVSLEGADCEPFVVRSTASMAWHGANGTGAAL